MAWQRYVNHTVVCSLSSPRASSVEATGQISLTGWRRADTLKGMTQREQQQGALSRGPLWHRDMPASSESWPPKQQRPGWQEAEVWGASTCRPAASPGQGQHEPLGRGERACQGGGPVQGFTCSKINTGHSVSLCSAVV